MPKRHYSKEILPRIEKLIAIPAVLENGWASRFLPSIRDQYRRRGSLSHAQFQSLERLEEQFSAENLLKLEENKRIYAENKQKEEEEWAEEYRNSPRLQEDGRVVSEYYRNFNTRDGRGLYSMVYESVLAGEVPKKSAFMKMIGNEYSKKVLEEWHKEPAYPVKSIVVPRKNRNKWYQPLENVEFAFVVKVNVEAPAAAKGGKKYLILPKGELKGIICEEREIKPYRRKKK